MKRLFQWTALAAIALILSSCGMPAALGRSAGRVMQSVSNVAGQAMTTGL
jgi:hypothetical protein